MSIETDNTSDSDVGGISGELAEPAPSLRREDASEDGGAATRSLGVERYIQFTYIAFALILFWLFNKLVELVWREYAEPSAVVVALVAALLGVGLSIALYTNKKVNALSTEVIVELSKVTWPTRRETQAATIVVIVASLIAAVFLGVLDFFWSALTDFIYTTKA